MTRKQIIWRIIFFDICLFFLAIVFLLFLYAVVHFLKAVCSPDEKRT